MALFHRCFPNILLVKTNYLVYLSVEHWSKMGEGVILKFSNIAPPPKIWQNQAVTSLDLNVSVEPFK